MDNLRKENIINHLISARDEQKQAIMLYYSQLHLKLPTVAKETTIGQLRNIGIFIDLENLITKDTLNKLASYDIYKRKVTEARETVIILKDKHKQAIRNYYDKLKSDLSPETINLPANLIQLK